MSIAQKVRRPISDTELKRRWEATREMMRQHELDLVFTQNNNMHLGGYVRWFSDIPAEYNYHMTVMVALHGEINIVRTGASKIPEWALRGLMKAQHAPFAPPIYYTSDAEADLVIKYFKAVNPKKVGYIGPSFINLGLMLRLREAFPQVTFVDMTNELDEIKALKSPEEMECVREAARIHDNVFAALPAIIRPGMIEHQIRAEVIKLLMDMGSEEHLVFIGTNEPGKPCGLNTFQYANRRMNMGDYGTILVEVSGFGGYYCESARNFCFGEPFPAMQKAWDTAVEAQQLTADLLTPGRPSSEIVEKYNKFVAEKGYCQEGRLYGHSQGYDLVERPAFMAHRDEGVETMKIQAGMNISLHPYFIDHEQTVYINDNYYVTENGAEKIHKTPPEIILL